MATALHQLTKRLRFSLRQALLGDGALNNQRRVEFPNILS